MLGGLRVRQGDREITRFSTQKTAVLLAYLAHHLREAHPREVLAERLWPGRSPKQGRVSLSAALSSLRRQLEPPGVPRGAIIQGDRFSVRLNPAAVTTDVLDFHAALRQAAGADSTVGRLQHLHDAVALYAGELLPGFYEDWVLVEQRRLADEYFEAALSLTTLLEQTGDIERAIEVARTALSHDPLREEAHGELMRLHAASGQPVTALRQYAELKKLLADELGEGPSAATERLARTIRAATPHVAATPPPCRPDMAPRRTGLPTGTVTLLLTDIEGAAALSGEMGEALDQVLESHHALLRREFRRHDAEEIREAGASFTVAFPSATDAAECAVACQRALGAHSWPEEVGPLQVRMAVYTVDVRPDEDEYRGVVLHRASRVLSAAHGGQILCSEATAALLKCDLRGDIQLADLGIYRLRDVPVPERLFQVNHPEMAARRFPPPRAEAGYRGSLPIELTRFFGREQELEELRALLTAEGQRLVTLTGPGGSGKTRLAQEAARGVMDHFGGAVWFVPLVDLREARLIPGAIADALGLARSPRVEPLDQLAIVLGEQSPLLILDNLEQLLPEAGPVVLSLLDRVRSARCLATSRQRLDLPGERLYMVPPLPTPEAEAMPEALYECPSVRLLVDRAQSAKPDFQLTEANAGAVAALCQRLEGIPLAIELAAARAQGLTPGQMVAQLDHRFDFLVSRRRATEERHRTLGAAMAWSCELLGPEVRRFFYELSVFRGGWTLEAAEAVCDQPTALQDLEHLRDASLVQTEESELGMRFSMLETLREFGRDQLPADDLVDLRRRHAAHFLHLAERAEREFLGPCETEWMDRLEADHDNLRAAFDWSGQDAGGSETELRLGGALMEFWSARGHKVEGRTRLSSALRRSELAAPAVRAKALYAAGTMTWLCVDRREAVPALQESVELYREVGDDEGAAWALLSLGAAFFPQDLERARLCYTEALALGRQAASGNAVAGVLLALGGLALWQENDGTAVPLLQESLAMLQSLGNRRWAAMALSRLGVLAANGGDTVRAQSLAEEALALARAARDPSLTSELLYHLAGIYVREGSYDAAAVHLEENLAIAGRLGLHAAASNSLNLLGHVRLAQGRHEQASELAKDALRRGWEMRLYPQMSLSVRIRALAALSQGQAVRGARLTGIMDTFEQAGGTQCRPGEFAASRDALVQQAREALGNGAFDAALAEGQAMAPEAAVEYALSDDDDPPSARAPGQSVQ